MPLLRTPLLAPGAGSSRQSCAIIGTGSVAGAAAGGLAPWHSGAGGCTAAQSSISSCARFSEHFFAAHRKELAALAALYCRELAVDGAIGETYGGK